MMMNHLILRTIDCWCDGQPLLSVDDKLTRFKALNSYEHCIKLFTHMRTKKGMNCY